MAQHSRQIRRKSLRPLGPLWRGALTNSSFRDRWKLLARGVSVKTTLLALIPVVAWIVFLVLFVSVYRAVIHVQGPAGVVLDVLRGLVEIVTMVIALKYFFEILERGAANELSIDSKDRS